MSHLHALKNVSITWHLIRLSGLPSKNSPSFAEILHSLSTYMYTPVRGVLNVNRCANNIDSQNCLLLNILFSGIKRIDFEFQKFDYLIFEHLTSFMEHLFIYFQRQAKGNKPVKGTFRPFEVLAQGLFFSFVSHCVSNSSSSSKTGQCIVKAETLIFTLATDFP